MTENVNKYQEELKDKLEDEYKNKLEIVKQQILAQAQQAQNNNDGKNSNSNLNSNALKFIGEAQNQQNANQEEILILKDKLAKLEKQYGFLVSKYNNANLKLDQYKQLYGSKD